MSTWDSHFAVGWTQEEGGSLRGMSRAVKSAWGGLPHREWGRQADGEHLPDERSPFANSERSFLGPSPRAAIAEGDPGSVGAVRYFSGYKTSTGPPGLVAGARNPYSPTGESADCVSSSSSRATWAIDAILSPSLRFMIRTPWVLRPTTRISRTWVRLTMPPVVMSMMSSGSRTDTTPTTLPLRSLVRMSRMPLPPRRCLR